MNFFQNFFGYNNNQNSGFDWNENYSYSNEPITNEQVILNNHQYNMNLINMDHLRKMQNLDNQYEEEKRQCEMKYQENLLKIDNDPTSYYYFEQKPNQVYKLKLDKEKSLNEKKDNIINNNDNFKISSNISNEEKRKREQQKRKFERQQREILRKKRLEESQKKFRKEIDISDNYDKDSEKRNEEYEQKMKSIIDALFDIDEILKSDSNNLPNQEEINKIKDEYKEKLEELKK